MIFLHIKLIYIFLCIWFIYNYNLTIINQIHIKVTIYLKIYFTGTMGFGYKHNK